jgi:hypothetical protein
MSPLSGNLTTLMLFQDHISAFKAFGHLKSLSLPSVSDLGMGYNPPWCGNAYRGNPGLRERLKKQKDEIIARLMHGISMEVIMQERSTLCEVVLGQRHWGFQIIWEKGEKGELYESKAVERSRKTGKVLSVTNFPRTGALEI